MLLPVSANNPELSQADIWVAASCAALEFCGGPKIEPKFGRLDHPDGKYCPPNGRLPDATKGAEHLREVFGRMGFNDQEIVALSGAHTLGSCH
jgi:catalase (peroxidase I)